MFLLHLYDKECFRFEGSIHLVPLLINHSACRKLYLGHLGSYGTSWDVLGRPKTSQDVLTQPQESQGVLVCHIKSHRVLKTHERELNRSLDQLQDFQLFRRTFQEFTRRLKLTHRSIPTLSSEVPLDRVSSSALINFYLKNKFHA